MQLTIPTICRSVQPAVFHDTRHPCRKLNATTMGEGMASTGGEINHVSDTALMVAACRAHENELEDAFARDPFAERLAGERGLAILNSLPHAGMMRLGLAIRTRFIDELLLETLASHPISTVLSVGCGLDTRPWRLDLSSNLRWIEIDFADMLDYKDRLMSGETPRCRRERLALDLNDPAQRMQIYDAASRKAALMITEGVLLYLPAATVDDLAAENWKHSGITHWISDITTTSFYRALGDPGAMQFIRHVRATDALTGEQILDVLRRQGWTTAVCRSYITDTGFARDRVLRMMGDDTPTPPSFAPDDPTGVHLFSHQ